MQPVGLIEGLTGLAKQRTKGMRLRRRARIAALQALFEADLAGHDANRALQQRLEEEPLVAEGADFAQTLVNGVLANQPVLDNIIRQTAPQWPLEQMSHIDVTILRIAIYELVIAKEVPVKVAINEAVELAKLFGSESSSRFVNGVLATVVKQHISS